MLINEHLDAIHRYMFRHLRVFHAPWNIKNKNISKNLSQNVKKNNPISTYTNNNLSPVSAQAISIEWSSLAVAIIWLSALKDTERIG